MAELDLVDRQILNALQGSIELVEQPFLAIAGSLGLTEEELLRRAQAMRERGVLRHLSPIFDVFRMGYRSALIAFVVEPGRLEEAAAVVTAHAGVSHNYAREHRFNLWFVLAIPRERDFEEVVSDLAARAGALSYNILPALKLFKIAVEYDMVGQRTDSKPATRVAPPPRRELKAREREIIRVCQDDLPLVSRPWAAEAQQLGTDERSLLRELRTMRDAGILRRFAAVLRHQEAGFSANGMACWRVEESRIEAVGSKLAADTRVSHCYWRPTFPDWPYPLFSMVHCETRDDVASVVADLAETVHVSDYEILWSAREFKKERVRYFVDEPDAARVR